VVRGRFEPIVKENGPKRPLITMDSLIYYRKSNNIVLCHNVIVLVIRHSLVTTCAAYICVGCLCCAMKPTGWTKAYNIVLCHIVIVLVIRHSLVKSMRTMCMFSWYVAQCNRQDGPTREGAHMAPKPYLYTCYN